MFAGKKSAQIREILISESAWEEMTCLFAPSLIAEGQMNKEIARSLAISAETVKWHIKNIYAKLKVNSRTQAMSRALEMKLLD